MKLRLSVDIRTVSSLLCSFFNLTQLALDFLFIVTFLCNSERIKFEMINTSARRAASNLTRASSSKALSSASLDSFSVLVCLPLSTHSSRMRAPCNSIGQHLNPLEIDFFDDADLLEHAFLRLFAELVARVRASRASSLIRTIAAI